MDPSFWAILLLFLTLLLLFFEILIPGTGGFLVFSAVVSLVFSVYAAKVAWWEHSPVYWWSYVGSVMILLPSAIYGALSVWPHTPIGRRSLPPTPDEVDSYVEEQQRLEQLLGQVGETITPLCPSGITRVAGQRLHSFSEGIIVPAETKIRVLAIRGNRVLVRPLTAEEQAKVADASDVWEQPEDDALLDFDLPPS